MAKPIISWLSTSYDITLALKPESNEDNLFYTATKTGESEQPEVTMTRTWLEDSEDSDDRRKQWIIDQSNEFLNNWVNGRDTASTNSALRPRFEGQPTQIDEALKTANVHLKIKEDYVTDPDAFWNNAEIKERDGVKYLEYKVTIVNDAGGTGAGRGPRF